MVGTSWATITTEVKVFGNCTLKDLSSLRPCIYTTLLRFLLTADMLKFEV